MSRANEGGSGNKGERARARRGGAHGTDMEAAHSLAARLRELAGRAEHDPALAERLRDALGASGLLDAPSRVGRRTLTTKAATATARRGTRTTGAAAEEPPDPFVLLRERGESGLRTALEGLDLAALRAIVRGHRLDPARISARWTAHERVIELIVTQVRGRAALGTAFARV
jgi:hypothetical protein